jgi:hypothetical protein
MFKFKVVSTGQRVGNINADPQLIVNPKTNRFRLTPNAAKLIACVAGESVTVLADTDSGLFAVHVATKRLNKDGEVVMKDVKMSEERKEELKAEGEEVPTEPVYINGCKLGNHLEFGSSNAVAQTGLTDNVICEHVETVTGDEIGLEASIAVAIFNYKDAQVESEDENQSEETE